MKHGALAILPLAAGAALYGFAFGLLAAQTGFPWWGIGLMSATVHAGSSQIVAVEQFAQGDAAAGAVLGAVLAGAALNLRYIGIAASLSGMLAHLPLAKKLLAIHMTGDENWALTMAERAKSPAAGAEFLLGSGLVIVLVWSLSTSLGGIAGALLPDLEALGLGFAFTAAFIAMARSLWRGRAGALPWVTAFACSLAAVLLGLPQAYAIVAGAVTGLAASALLRKAGRALA